MWVDSPVENAFDQYHVRAVDAELMGTLNLDRFRKCGPCE